MPNFTFRVIRVIRGLKKTWIKKLRVIRKNPQDFNSCISCN
jgi:hypothetical protein